MALQSLIEITDSSSYGESGPIAEHSDWKALYSIVAVHGIYEEGISTWTDPATNNLWLRDLYKHHQARVLVYCYKADALASSREGGADRILSYAISLVAELYADRSYTDAEYRPIIFVCHGIGGLIVKRALVSSSTRRGVKVEHLRSIFISTYAIIFLGTPHKGINKNTVFLPWQEMEASPSQFLISLLEGSEMVREIEDMFAPLIKQFAIYNFWEQLETISGEFKGYIVGEDSAAPSWDNAERCGISATHSGMVKMSSKTDYGYRVIEEALRRYTKNAPAVIRIRRQKDMKLLENERKSEAEALLRPHRRSSVTDNRPSGSLNEWFLVTRSPTKYFTGRQSQADLVRNSFANIQKRNETTRTQPNIFVVYGLGGSGKTQFCLKYSWDNSWSYWGVFWIDASSEGNIESGFAFIGQQAGKGASFAAGKHYISKCTKPWLLILDNADDPDIDLTQYFPVRENGHILITTRNPRVVEYATVGHIRFSGMEPEEAISLLLKSVYPKNETEIPDLQSLGFAQGIASELGYLALAITQAGTTIRRGIYTLERYLKVYLLHRKTVICNPKLLSADETNIITTWEIPFQKMLTHPSIDYKDAVTLVHIFAFLHFEHIPEQILQRSWSSIERSRSGDLYPGILQPREDEGTQARLRRALRVLYDYSIIDYEPEIRSCSLHPVVSSWARDRLDQTEQRRWLSQTMAILALCISPNLETSGRKFRRLLLPHMDSCLRSLKLQHPSFPESFNRAIEIEKFAWIYAENGLWNTACTLQTKILDFRLKLLGKGHEATILAQKTLGFTYWNLFEIKPAINIQLEVLKSLWWRRPSFSYWCTWSSLKPDHIPYCMALSDLTLALWLAGRREESKYVGERAVAGLLRRLGPDDPTTLTAMFNLARTHLHLGNYEECHRLLVWVLGRRRHFFGYNHPDTLMVRNELGILLCAKQRNLFLAEHFVRSVLETRREILGEEHAYTLWSVNDLSKVLCERRRPYEAVQILEEIIPVVTRTLGEEHVGMFMTKSNLARAYALSEDLGKAEDVLGSLLPMISPEHPDWFHNMLGYIRLKVRQGNFLSAEKDCLSALNKISKDKIPAIDDGRTVAIGAELVKMYRVQNRSHDVTMLKQRIPRLGTHMDDVEADNFDVYSIRKGSWNPGSVGITK